MRAALTALALAALALLLPAGPARADEDSFVLIERGRKLATIGDCVACHNSATGQPYAGGRGIATPFGTINSANLTPDLETGIGTWTADDLYRAMHEGRRPDGAYLYPAFPYTHYTIVTRPDVEAIFAYLRSLPPVYNKVDRNSLPLPFRIRTLMAGWNALFFTPHSFQPDPNRSAAFNRGAYLVQGLGHCGVCHTPMNAFGANKSDRALQGNRIGDWWAPDITSDPRTGIGSWSADQIVAYLRTGRNDISAATGPMAEVVMYSTALMDEGDLRAIATFLKESPAPAGRTAPTPAAADTPAMRAGQAIYIDTCQACHGADGKGTEHLFPRLAGAPGVQQTDPASIAHVVLAGTRSAVTAAAVTGPAMPALGWRLDDGQVASVLTYIGNSWGNAAPGVTAAQVKDIRGMAAGR